MLDNKQLEKEYDSIFDSEEKILHLLKIESDAYTRELKTISISKIGSSEPIKKSRAKTKIGLTTTVRELGVMCPIHVMTTENYGKENDDSAVEAYDYILLDGMRRIYGACKNGLKTIQAVVWDFKDKEKGREVALILGLVLNKTQHRSWEETWGLMQVLEIQSNASIVPGALDRLLDLQQGESMKLKDIMLSDDDEAKTELLGEKKSLEQCYRILQRHRKEINLLEQEDNSGISDIEEAKEIVKSDSADNILLSDEEVKSLLDIDVETLPDSIEDLNKTQEIRGIEKQKVGERHPIDPAIKQARLIKDNFYCKCCGKGGQTYLGILVFHHKVPVSAGGPDTVDNGLTLCSNCHIRLHIYVDGDLILPDLETLEEAERMTLCNIMRYGNIAIKAYQLRNMNRKQIKEVNSSGRRHLMPGEGLKINEQAFNKATVTA